MQGHNYIFFARILFSNSNQLNRKFVNDIQPFGIRIEALGVIACNERSFSRMNASVHCMNLEYYCLVLTLLSFTNMSNFLQRNTIFFLSIHSELKEFKLKSTERESAKITDLLCSFN